MNAENLHDERRRHALARGFATLAAARAMQRFIDHGDDCTIPGYSHAGCIPLARGLSAHLPLRGRDGHHHARVPALHQLGLGPNRSALLLDADASVVELEAAGLAEIFLRRGVDEITADFLAAVDA